MKDDHLTWEQSVEWLRNQPEKNGLVRNCYYDDPVEEAASRFYQSQEWKETALLLREFLPCRVLDIGAGRGISSYAFSREGCTVTALEPDSSPIVGSFCIKSLNNKVDPPIRVIRGYSESLPFKDRSFDIVYGRAVLHHSRDLRRVCCDAGRVLTSGGIFMSTREHVISSPNDLEAFRRSHPLHTLYGGENAFQLKEYLAAIKSSGLIPKKTIGPYESVINYAPISQEEHMENIISMSRRFLGYKASRIMVSVPLAVMCINKYLSRRSNVPGRLFSFIAVKP